MPESLQQKVDRMTAGMEVTVTYGGTRPGTVTGPVTSEGGVPFVVGRPVRFNDGRVNPFITAIDMPDPECPFEIGARVLCDGDKRVWTVTGWAFIVGFGAWMVWLEDDAGIRGLSDPDELTLVPPEPAPFKPGDKVRWNANTRADNDDRENRKTVARCEKVGGYWRVYYVRDADERYDRWDFADGLELAPEPAEPNCPAILVTYPSGLQFARARDDNGDFGGMDWREWQAVFADHRITVQALRPTEYLQRGGA